MSATEPTFVLQRPGRWRHLFFKGPILLYRDGPAELMRQRCVLLLTTRGRRTGQPRTTGISFMPLDGRFIVFAGYGIRADWYRNLLAHPEVTLQVGRRRIAATAVPVAAPDRRRALMQQVRARARQCGPPSPRRGLLLRLGIFDDEGDLDMAIDQEGALPVVELMCRDGSATAS